MADQKLSDLTAATTVDPADLVYTAQGGASKKATRELLQTYNAGTLTTDKKVLDLSATWNAAGTTFTGVKLNVTDTASASGSLLMDLQVGGTSAAKISKGSVLTLRAGGFDSTLTPSFGNITFGGEARAPTGDFGVLRIGQYVSGNGVFLERDAANTLAQRNSTNVQAFRLYRTFTDASNLAYTAAKQDATTGYILDSVNAGTGTEPTNLLDLQLNGSSKAKVAKDGSFYASNIGTENGLESYYDTASAKARTVAKRTVLLGANLGLSMSADFPIAWSSNTAGNGDAFGNRDIFLYRDAANTLAQRNSTNAQTFRVYGTFTDSSNYERGYVGWVSNELRIGMERAGTGSGRGIRIQTSSTGGYINLEVNGSDRIAVSSSIINANLPIEFTEQTAPAAPAANKVRIYAEDDGAGKTRLMALFPTGAAQQIAIEP